MEIFLKVNGEELNFYHQNIKDYYVVDEFLVVTVFTTINGMADEVHKYPLSNIIKIKED